MVSIMEMTPNAVEVALNLTSGGRLLIFSTACIFQNGFFVDFSYQILGKISIDHFVQLRDSERILIFLI